MIIYIKKCQSANDLEIIDISPNNSSAFSIGCRSDNKSRAMRQNIRTPKGIVQSQVASSRRSDGGERCEVKRSAKK